MFAENCAIRNDTTSPFTPVKFVNLAAFARLSGVELDRPVGRRSREEDTSRCPPWTYVGPALTGNGELPYLRGTLTSLLYPGLASSFATHGIWPHLPVELGGAGLPSRGKKTWAARCPVAVRRWITHAVFRSHDSSEATKPIRCWTVTRRADAISS